jgi:hypothetical protein
MDEVFENAETFFKVEECFKKSNVFFRKNGTVSAIESNWNYHEKIGAF